MSQTEIRTTQEEYLARRLLANGATGALPHLNALAHAYPYHGSDLRPVELVMSFLRDPPLSYPSLRLGASGGVNTEPLLRTLACLDVVHRVGRSVASDTPSCTAFSVMLKDGWPSLLVWLTYTLEYVEMVMPGARAGVPISTVANFLVAYSTRPPFAHHTIDDWTSTIRLAFRIWIGEFSQGLTFRNVTLTTIEFFSNCLEMDGSAKAAVVEIFQDSNRAWAFFKSFGTQITTLARDPTEAGAMRVVLMHDFYVLLVEHLSKSPDWRNTWRWIIQKGPLKACVATTLSLLSRPISIDRWRLAQLGSVMVAVEEDIEAILSKVVRLSRAGLAPLLRQCGRSTVSGVSDMVIFGFLRHLASYLPYQRVSRAVTKSLERYHANNPSALQDAGWNFFYSTLKLSVLSAAKRRGYFAFACDNLNHLGLQDLEDDSPVDGESRKVCGGCRTVWYCSEECQKDDWNSLHRYECIDAAALLYNRRQRRQWFPWGSRGNHGALLVHIFNLLCLGGADVGPMDSVSTLDWTMGAPGDATSQTRDEYRASLAGRSPEHTQGRLSAMLSLSGQTGTRLVEATYRHGKERIHILATLRQGHWPGGYTFLNGVGTISERHEGDTNL